MPIREEPATFVLLSSLNVESVDRTSTLVIDGSVANLSTSVYDINCASILVDSDTIRTAESIATALTFPVAGLNR